MLSAEKFIYLLVTTKISQPTILVERARLQKPRVRGISDFFYP